MIWENLSDRIASICREWRDQLFSEHVWERHEEQPKAGEAKGFRVRADGVPHGAYLKPTRPNSDQLPRSANEKICSDLANDLSLPVPPALLYVREDAPDGKETHVVLSLILADRVWRYKDIKQVSDPPWDLVEDALERGSGTVAFDTWIGHQDRNNGGNLVFFQDPDTGDYRVAYIDYAYTLNRNERWENGDPTDVSLPNSLPKVLENVDEHQLREALREIEELEEEDIRRVVDRIPDDYMTESHQDVVARALLDRRSEVRPVLEERFSI